MFTAFGRLLRPLADYYGLWPPTCPCKFECDVILILMKQRKHSYIFAYGEGQTAPCRSCVAFAQPWPCLSAPASYFYLMRSKTFERVSSPPNKVSSLRGSSTTFKLLFNPRVSFLSTPPSSPGGLLSHSPAGTARQSHQVTSAVAARVQRTCYEGRHWRAQLVHR